MWHVILSVIRAAVKDHRKGQNREEGVNEDEGRQGA